MGRRRPARGGRTRAARRRGARSNFERSAPSIAPEAPSHAHACSPPPTPTRDRIFAYPACRAAPRPGLRSVFVRAVESSRHWIEGGCAARQACVRACLYIPPGTRLEVGARRPAFAFDVAALAIASQARGVGRGAPRRAGAGWLARPVWLHARFAFHLRISLSGAAY